MCCSQCLRCWWSTSHLPYKRVHRAGARDSSCRVRSARASAEVFCASSCRTQHLRQWSSNCNFGSRTECLTYSSSKPPLAERKATALRHLAFMFGEKMLQPCQPGQKCKLHVHNCSGVQLKALLVFGQNVAVDFLTGRLSVDGWIHAQSAPRDAAMLLGLRRLSQDHFRRRLSCMSSGTMTKATLLRRAEVLEPSSPPLA